MRNCRHCGEDLKYVLVELDLTILAQQQSLLGTVTCKTKAEVCEIQVISFIFFLSWKQERFLVIVFLQR